MLAGNVVNHMYVLVYVISVDEGESNDNTSIRLNGSMLELKRPNRGQWSSLHFLEKIILSETTEL